MKEGEIDVAVKKSEFSKKSADPVEVALAKYDKNGDGIFSNDEVRGIVNEVMKESENNKMLRKFIGLLMIVIVATLFAMFGVSFAAGFALKDTRVTRDDNSGSAPMRATDGTPISMDVSESSLGFYDLPSRTTAELSRLKTVTAYVDMTTGAAGGWVEFMAKLATVYKSDATTATLETYTGHVLTINRNLQTATISMNGQTFPVAPQPPEAARRQLEAKYDEAAKVDGKPHNINRRRGLRRGGFGGFGDSQFLMSGGGGISLNRAGNT